MKTTVELPDELYRTVKVTAAREGRSVKDVMVELLRRGLAGREAAEGEVQHRVKLPLVHGLRTPPPEEQLTPERVAELLLADDVDNLTT